MTPHITIIGGSLAGLTLALACSKLGLSVRIYERASVRTSGGDSLAVNLADLANVTGKDPRLAPKLPVVPAYRDRHLTTWPALYNWLATEAAQSPNIETILGRNVTDIRFQENGIELLFSDGYKSLEDLVIGADGYSSIVRRFLNPTAPFAKYAGYIVWRGLVEEKLLSKPVNFSSNQGLWITFNKGYRLVAAVLPGRDGSLAIGDRQITFAWFDTNRESLLRHKNCITLDDDVIGTLGRQNIDASIRLDLSSRVDGLWPAAWAEAVKLGVNSQEVLSGSPIAQYQAKSLAKGALAMIGDAAHVVSPMTGSGFAAAVDDAAVLSHLLAEKPASQPVTAALERYEAARLPSVRRLANLSQKASLEFVQYARNT